MANLIIPTLGEIESVVQRAINEALIKHRELEKQKKEYLTRNQVANKLNIALSTVHNYIDKGILTPYKIGGRTLFRADEVEKALIRLQKK